MSASISKSVYPCISPSNESFKDAIYFATGVKCTPEQANFAFGVCTSRIYSRASLPYSTQLTLSVSSLATSLGRTIKVIVRSKNPFDPDVDIEQPSARNVIEAVVPGTKPLEFVAYPAIGGSGIVVHPMTLHERFVGLTGTIAAFKTRTNYYKQLLDLTVAGLVGKVIDVDVARKELIKAEKAVLDTIPTLFGIDYMEIHCSDARQTYVAFRNVCKKLECLTH